MPFAWGTLKSMEGGQAGWLSFSSSLNCEGSCFPL